MVLTLGHLKLHQKYLVRFKIWCWRRMEKKSWTDRVRSEGVLHRVYTERNILHTIKRRKANWIGHILRRNCLLKQVIEGEIDTEKDRCDGKMRKKTSAATGLS